MLSRTHRLRSSRDIAKTYAKGRYSGGGMVSAKSRHTGLPVSRAVVVVGKKVSKKATVRNRLRRQVAAALASEWQTVGPGYDIVITVHQDLAKTSPAELTKLVRGLLDKTGATNQKS